VLEAIFDSYASYEYILASSQLFLAMLGMGALLTPQDFLLELRNPRGLVTGLAFQWALVPLIALGLGAIMPIPAGIAVGLILIAAVPGGTLSNILTLFGRGNIALSISLTSITTVAALVTTPLLLQLLISQYLPQGFRMPAGRLALDIFVTLVVPLAIGMLVRQHANVVLCANFSKWVIRVSLSLIVIMAVGAGGSGRLDANAYGSAGVVSLVLFCLAVQGSALLVCRLGGMKAVDSLAVIIEVGFRNMSLAVAVKAVVFPAQAGVLDPLGDAVLFTALLYGGVSLFMSLPAVLINRRLTPASPAPATAGQATSA
tara:strand:- start:3194 stop:4138 length:945 start_codon:yes stop_codon:yes gene_type:complete